MAKYSIILPVRNGGHYLKTCVDSILSQTYTDFNFIILDNCSTDGSSEWLQSLNDVRIKIIPSNRSLTIEENWGRIKDVEKNEFMTLIGHDDILYPDFLQTIDDLLKLHPSASLFHTYFDFIDAGGNVIRHCKPMKPVYDGSEFLKGIITGSIDSMGTGYVMRAKDYDELKGIPVKYPSLLFADFELWVNLAAKGFASVATDYCFAFRVHQSTTGKSADRKLHAALAVFTDYLVDLKGKDEKMGRVIIEYGSLFLANFCKSYSHRLLRTPLPERNGITVNSFILQTILFAKKLGVQDNYHPEKIFLIRIAQIMDNHTILRNAFLRFKKIYTKPIFRK